MLSVNIYIENDKIVSQFVADSYFFEKDKYDYAFYLMKDGEKEKLNARWYENSMEAKFDITDIHGLIFVKCFVRDKNDKSVRTFDSENIFINS